MVLNENPLEGIHGIRSVWGLMHNAAWRRITSADVSSGMNMPF